VSREAVVPLACLMNHAATAAHVRQYGQLQDGWLHFPASCSITAGEQVHAVDIWSSTGLLQAQSFMSRSACTPPLICSGSLLSRCTCTTARMTMRTCWPSTASYCRTTHTTASTSASR
jgi:hypothetical protein